MEEKKHGVDRLASLIDKLEENKEKEGETPKHETKTPSKPDNESAKKISATSFEPLKEYSTIWYHQLSREPKSRDIHQFRNGLKYLLVKKEGKQSEIRKAERDAVELCLNCTELPQPVAFIGIELCPNCLAEAIRRESIKRSKIPSRCQIACQQENNYIDPAECLRLQKKNPEGCEACAQPTRLCRKCGDRPIRYHNDGFGICLLCMVKEYHPDGHIFIQEALSKKEVIEEKKEEKAKREEKEEEDAQSTVVERTEQKSEGIVERSFDTKGEKETMRREPVKITKDVLRKVTHTMFACGSTGAKRVAGELGNIGTSVIRKIQFELARLGVLGPVRSKVLGRELLITREQVNEKIPDNYEHPEEKPSQKLPPEKAAPRVTKISRRQKRRVKKIATLEKAPVFSGDLSFDIKWSELDGQKKAAAYLSFAKFFETVCGGKGPLPQALKEASELMKGQTQFQERLENSETLIATLQSVLNPPTSRPQRRRK